ncbi:hypothetical protein [Gemmatimonas sp.]
MTMPRAVTYCEPEPTTDAARVLAIIRAQPGRPTWWIAAHCGLDRGAVRSATHYLRRRAFIHPRPVVQPQPSTGVLYPIPCWYSCPPMATRTPTTATHCRVILGMGHQCGTRLEFTVLPLGDVQVSCPACRRRAAGWCRSCPRPTVRKSPNGPAPWYCAECVTDRRRAMMAKKYRSNRYRQQHAREERSRVRHRGSLAV